jgi:hypothetical protein
MGSRRGKGLSNDVGPETLRQKDYRKKYSLERPRYEVTKGVSPQAVSGQSLR